MKSSREIASCLALISTIPLGGVRLHAQCAGSTRGAELFTGSAWHLPMPLEVELPEGRKKFRAHYSTRPFTQVPYYSYRFARSWANGRGVEVEM